MNRLLFLFCLLLCFSIAHTQPGYLFVKKGIHKKRTYMEGDRIILQTNNGEIHNGLITLLQNDTIFINGLPVPRKTVQTVFTGKKKKKFDVSTSRVLLLTAGAALTTIGLEVSGYAKDFKQAAGTGLALGFGNMVIDYLRGKITFKRNKYKIGKKFYLQVLDFHIARKRGF